MARSIDELQRLHDKFDFANAADAKLDVAMKVLRSNYITLNYVRHTLTWNLIRNVLLSTEFFFEDAQESGGPLNATLFSVLTGQQVGESFQRIGGAITLGYQLTPHITLGVRYQGTSKDSNVFLRDYNQNRVSVDGTYSF